jgi:RNA polymerase sigma factor (sigma-70 family)
LAVDDSHVSLLLQTLGSTEARDGWKEFLEQFSPLILQVVRHFEYDPDRVADCFLFACEHLSRDRFRRLRRFRLGGAASFSTWLRAVVRNLCCDWHRREFGRERVFESIARLSPFDQEVFRAIYEDGSSEEEAYLALRSRQPQLTRERLTSSRERIDRVLTPRHRWLLSLRSAESRSEAAAAPQPDGKTPEPQLSDTAPNPEEQATFEERRTALRRGLARLTAQERLLVRLRFEEDLSLEQIARAMRLGDAFAVHRRLGEILDRLRKGMD